MIRLLVPHHTKHQKRLTARWAFFVLRPAPNPLPIPSARCAGAIRLNVRRLCRSLAVCCDQGAHPLYGLMVMRANSTECCEHCYCREYAASTTPSQNSPTATSISPTTESIPRCSAARAGPPETAQATRVQPARSLFVRSAKH